MTPATGRRARAQIALAIVVGVMTLSSWFATSAAAPSLERAGIFSGSLAPTIAVQAGFAVGAIAVGLTRLADRSSPARLVPAGAVVAIVLTLLPIVVPTLPAILASRTLLGATLALIYPTVMRSTLSWAGPRWRALAVAGIVAALTVGSALPQLFGALPSLDWEGIFVTSAILTGIGGVLAFALRTGPQLPPMRPTSFRSLRVVVGNPLQRKITVAYLGHMWEVYGLWVCLPMVLAALPHTAGLDVGTRSVLAFGLIGVAGTVGCVAGGMLSSRWGEYRSALLIASACGVVAVATVFLAGSSTVLIVGFLALWCALAIADSGLYSALTGRVSGDEAAGTAIALQMGLGYAVTAGMLGLPQLSAFLSGSWRIGLAVLLVGSLASFAALIGGDRGRSLSV